MKKLFTLGLIFVTLPFIAKDLPTQLAELEIELNTLAKILPPAENIIFNFLQNDSSFNVGLIGTSPTTYNLVIRGPKLEPDSPANPLTIEDFYQIEIDKRTLRPTLQPSYPLMRITDPDSQETYTLRKNLNAPPLTQEEETARWDWRATDLKRERWLHSAKDLKTLRTYQPKKVNVTLKDYLDNIIVMVDTQVLTVPQELKYVDYLLEVLDLLDKIKRAKGQEKVYRDMEGLIQQKIEAIKKLKNEMINNLDWAAQRLVWIVLKKQQQQEKQQAAEKDIWRKVQEKKEQEQESDEESDDEWSDSSDDWDA